jgi:hypothetical protein
MGKRMGSIFSVQKHPIQKPSTLSSKEMMLKNMGMKIGSVSFKKWVEQSNGKWLKWRLLQTDDV